MKKSPVLTISIFLIIVLGFFSYGCKKEKEEVDYDTESSKDNAQAESIMNEINEIADQAVEDGILSTHRLGSGSSSLFTSCGTITVTIDSTDSSGTASIDFGDHFCKSPNDSKYRKGLISVSFTGPYREAGTVITITATNYFVGTIDSTSATKVNGQRIVTNQGMNGNGNLYYSVTANVTLVNYLNELLTWSSTRSREWIAGEPTSAWNDDEYLITGGATGKSYAGVNFTMSIIEALLIKPDCRYITKGKFTLTPENKEPRTLDYGDGGCDGDATVTIKDKTYNITLR
jgi:hypothetical protein